MCFVQFLGGYVRLFGDASIRRLKPLLGKGCQTNSLPIGLNRISWKLSFLRRDLLHCHCESLPIGLNRISWKPINRKAINRKLLLTLPIGLNRISWKLFIHIDRTAIRGPLPIGLNRISWKHSLCW